MQSSKNITAILYKASIIAAGALSLAYLTATVPFTGNWWQFVFLCLLAIFTETQTVTIGETGVAITISVLICAMLTCNISEAAWISTLAVLGTYSKSKGQKPLTIFNIPATATLFNAAGYELSLLAAYSVYQAMDGITLSSRLPFETVMHHINGIATALIASILVFVIVNSLTVAVYMSLYLRQNLRLTWLSGLFWSVASLFFLGLMGVLITAVYISYGWFLVMVLFAPFMLARYVFSMYKDLQENYLQTVTCLATAIETKDTYTIGHSRRVEFYSSIIAAELGLFPKRCQLLRYAALLHDIGKIGIDEATLRKPGALTAEEFAMLREHPAKGEHIVQEIEFLADASKIIRSHHERYDGKGYPDGLTGKELPLEALILTVADSYDAMTSDRPYRQAYSHEKAMSELYACSGTQFAPQVVKAFDKAMKKRGNKPYVV